MNNFLILVIVLMGGGAIYEYTILEQQLQHAQAAEFQGLTNQGDKIDTILAESRKMEADKLQLAVNLQVAQNKILDLTAQLQTAQKALEDMRLSALAAQAAAQAAAQPPDPNKPPAPPAPPPIIKLGTIVTEDGKTYENCQLLKVEADGITFSHSAGITKVMFRLLPPDLQKRFGYDPVQADGG